MAMRKFSSLRSSSCLLSQRPWHISQRDTWHLSKCPHLAIQSQSETFPKLPNSSPLPKLLPKLLHPFNGSMSMPPLFQEGPNWVEEKNDTFKNLAKLMHPLDSSMSMPSILPQKEPKAHEGKPDTNALGKARRLLWLTQLNALKERLEKETHDVMACDDLLKLCISMGVASSSNGAAHLVKCLDDAGVILIFQDFVHLRPQKIVELVNGVMPRPFFTTKEQESILQEVSQEVSKLQQEKEEIDKLAYKHSRRVLWLGFFYLTFQMAFIFRLTFWELSWDVMEPIAYFVTNITLLAGYAFFMFTSKHPTYKDLTTIILSSKQKKLMKKRKFDKARLLELQKRYQVLPSFSFKNP